MISLRLTFFGSPQIHLNGRLVQLKNRKALALLAYLVLGQLPQSREKLMSVFWPEFSQERASANLRVILHVLKKHLTDDWLDIRRHEVEVKNTSMFWVDVLEFQQHFHHVNSHDPGLSTTCAQCLPLLLTAIELYRDDFLRGFTLPDSPAFDEWQAFHTDLFRENLSESLHRVVRYYTRHHELLPAIDYARRWIAFFPWSETAHRELMRLYGLNHQRPAALQQYQECVRMLRKEFGVEPEEQTQDLYDAIRNQKIEELCVDDDEQSYSRILSEPDAALATPREHPNNLPAQVTSFIGREAEVSMVSNIISQPDVRLITLTGPGGSGKTRLSLQAAAKMLAKMADGVFFVSLAPISNPEFVISTIVKTLGLYVAGNSSPLTVLNAYLQKKQLLLVLDNFEQIAAAAPVLIDLLTAAAGLKILVTSRTVLRISGEHTYLVPPLRVPDLANFPSFHYLTQFEAIRLFTERAKAINMDFILTEENAPAVAEICARLHGLPLAIELATAHVSMFSPKAMLDQLDRPLHFLTDGARDLPTRQQTLRNTIVWSCNLLNEEEQILFRRLAVFVGGWTVEAAEAVCAYPPTDDDVRPKPVEGPGQGSAQVLDVLTCLESLLDKNLITRIAVEGELRFSMLETIREYALEQLTASGEAETIRQRHAHVMLALVEEAESKRWTVEQPVWLKRLEMELDNLRAALAWSIDNMIELGLQLAGTLEHFWVGSVYHSEGREWLAKALKKSETCRIDIVSFRAKALTAAGTLAWFQGAFATAYTLEEESVALARKAGDNTCLALALMWLGISAEPRGEHAKARALIEESIALCRHIHNPRLLTETLYWYVYVTFEGREYEQARASAEECIALARETGNIHFLAAGTISLGNIAIEQGNYVKAQSFYEKGLELHQKIQDKLSTPHDLNWLGAALCAQGNYKRARTCHERSLEIFREYGSVYGIACSLQGLGKIALHQQRWQEALTCFVESLVLSRKQDDIRSIARSLTGLAAVAKGQEQPERAAQLLGATATLLESTGVSYWRSPIFRTDYERITAAVRNALGEEAFAAETAKGRAMPLEQAITYGLDNSLHIHL